MQRGCAEECGSRFSRRHESAGTAKKRVERPQCVRQVPRDAPPSPPPRIVRRRTDIPRLRRNGEGSRRRGPQGSHRDGVRCALDLQRLQGRARESKADRQAAARRAALRAVPFVHGDRCACAGGKGAHPAAGSVRVRPRDQCERAGSLAVPVRLRPLVFDALFQRRRDDLRTLRIVDAPA